MLEDLSFPICCLKCPNLLAYGNSLFQPSYAEGGKVQTYPAQD